MDYHTDIPEIDSAIDARMEVLSPTVRYLLNGDAVPTLAATLSAQHGLSEDMQSGVEREIALVLMYMEPVDEFATNLMVEYLIAPEAAIEIEKEVTAKLFAPIMNELGHSSELETAGVPSAPIAPPVIAPSPAPTPQPTQPPPVAPVPNPTPAPHVPVARVMPHSKAEAQHDPRASTELPNALLQNLKASLMHSVPEEPLEGTNPTPSYNAILNPKPPTLPPTPPNTPPHP